MNYLNNLLITTGVRAKAETKVRPGVELQDGMGPREEEILTGSRFLQREQQKQDLSEAILTRDLIRSGK